MVIIVWLSLCRGRSRKVPDASDSTDAQKKFGDAKSISSDQYFGGGRDPDVSLLPATGFLPRNSCCLLNMFHSLTVLILKIK